VTMNDFEEAIDRVVAGLEKRNRLMNPREKEIVAYHETGHALVAEGLPNVDRVHRVSIIPRGIGSLGYTMQLPTEDRYLMTKSELEDRMVVMLGGRVAEEVQFGEISTGAQNDLYRATDIARSMVREYGMSEHLGPLTFERERRPLFLEGMMPPATKDYSEATAQEIDHEVSSLVIHAYTRAKEILETKRETLEKVAKVLLEKEVLEGEELRKLLNEKKG
jgi:cell division protease FtsH